MCGIVGILGTGPVAGSIVDALKRLEYRGYDSAGVATLENGRLERRRAEGKLKNLEAETCRGARRAGRSASATRAGGDAWQAHGDQRHIRTPRAEARAVVHNGIIENFQGLAARNFPPAKGAMRLRPKPIPKLRRSSSRTNSDKGKRRGGGSFRRSGPAARRVRAPRLSIFEGEEDLLIGGTPGGRSR